MSISSEYLLNAFEALLAAFACIIALWRPTVGERFIRKCSYQWGRLASNKVGAVLSVGLAAILIRAALLPIVPIPDPSIHDEFGHLLIGDTFAAGRLTNPPNPYWTHFESIYILQQPTYTAQYPPAIGLTLGAAQFVFGQPWLGVLIGMGVFCTLMCWMLQAWMPPRWALLGGVLAVLQFALISYWVNSYWGGAVPGIGGLLVLGGLGRLRRGPLLRNSVWIAIGLAILMNSRPTEALIFGCVTCALVCWWVFKTAELELWPAVRSAALPMAVLLSITVGGMAYYNYRVTGRPLLLPYILHQRLYGSPQAYWWQKPIIVKSFRHKEQEDDYLKQLRLWQRRSSPAGLTRAIFGRIRDFWFFYIGVVLTLPLLFFRWAIRDQGMPLMLAISAPFAFDYLTFHAFYAHYAAPVSGITMFIVLACWRHLRLWQWRGRPSGLFLSRMMPAVLAIGVFAVLAARVLAPHADRLQPVLKALYRDYIPIHSRRTIMAEDLAKMRGQHLVFVHYDQPGHSPDYEWVYNRADLNKAQIVWARDLGADSNDELRCYFARRRTWLVDADAKHPSLVPYPALRMDDRISFRKPISTNE